MAKKIAIAALAALMLAGCQSTSTTSTDVFVIKQLTARGVAVAPVNAAEAE